MALALGLRVVRGPDWGWGQQDGGKGFVGTVVEGAKGCGAVVQWDSGSRGKYRCGLEGKYDLRVLDSGPSGLYFPGVRCFGCGLEGISGYQWKCAACPDYQLCGTCYMSDYHSLHHKFKCIINRRGHGYKVMSRFKFRRWVAKGLFPGATVTRGHDWRWKNQDGGPGSGGQLLKVANWKDGSYRSVVEVEWKSSSRRNSYRVGYKGKVDLVFGTPGQGPLFYLDHLPVLGGQIHKPGEKEFMAGDRVRCEPDIEALRSHTSQEEELSELVSMMLDGTGVVTKEILLTGEFAVRFANNSTHPIHSSMMTRVNCHLHKERDVVRMIEDIGEAYKLQQGHGEWRDDMALNLGQVGVVRQVKGSGAVVVQFEQFEWILNPACVNPAPDATPPDFKGTGDGLMTALMDLGISSLGLFHAVKIEDETKMKFYLEAHPDQINEVIQGRTPLELAIEEGRNKAVRLLVQEYKADIERAGNNLKRPIHICAQANNEEAARLLLAAGADVNAPESNGVTALMVASALDHARTVKVLATHPSTNLNARDSKGTVALLYSIRYHRSLNAAILLDHKADPLAVSNTKTCLHDAGFHDNLPAMEEMARRSPEHLNWKMPLGGGHAPLHIAAIKNSYSVVEFLCRHPSCDINCREGEGRTVLHCVAIEGNTDMVELVVGYGVNVNQDDGLGNSALHLVLYKKLGYPPNEHLSPQLTKVKYKLKRMLGAESVASNYLVLACFLAQERTSIVKKSQIFNKTALELCPPEYRDVLRNFVNKPGNFCGSLKKRDSKVASDSNESSEQIHSFNRRQTSTVRQRDRAALSRTSSTVTSSLGANTAVATSASSVPVTTSTVSNTVFSMQQVTPSTPQATPSMSQAVPSLKGTSAFEGITSTTNHSGTRPNTKLSYANGNISTSNGSTSVSNGSTSVSNGSTSVSHGNTSVSDGNTSVPNGSTSVSTGSTCESTSNTSLMDNSSVHSLVQHQQPVSVDTSVTATTVSTTTITTGVLASPVSSIVNEFNSAPSLLKPSTTLSTKPLEVKNTLSMSVKNSDPLSSTKTPDLLDAKKNKISLVTKGDSEDFDRDRSIQAETHLFHYSNTGSLSSLQQQLQPNILRLDQINESVSRSKTGESPPLCMVCEDVCDVQFVPCGHVMVCSECGHRIKRCPLCKVVVQKKIAVNWN